MALRQLILCGYHNSNNFLYLEKRLIEPINYKTMPNIDLTLTINKNMSTGVSNYDIM